jgi:hypothetical protein
LIGSQDSKPTPAANPHAFWVGLALMAVFACAGVGGGTWALERVLLERSLYAEGRVTSGIVLQKRTNETKGSSGGTKSTTYSVRYRFEAGPRTVTDEARIERSRFYDLSEDAAIQVRYLPDDPEESLPDGSRLSGLFLFYVVFGYAIGLGALTAVCGMIAGRVRGDAGERSPLSRNAA